MYLDSCLSFAFFRMIVVIVVVMVEMPNGRPVVLVLVVRTIR